MLEHYEVPMHLRRRVFALYPHLLKASIHDISQVDLLPKYLQVSSPSPHSSLQPSTTPPRTLFDPLERPPRLSVALHNALHNAPPATLNVVQQPSKSIAYVGGRRLFKGPSDPPQILLRPDLGLAHWRGAEP